MSLRQILERRATMARSDLPAEVKAPAVTTPTPAPKPAEPAPAMGPRPVPLVDPGDPRAALWWYLDTWAGMNEDEWAQDAVTALYNAVIGFWTDYPDVAEGWWRDWRAAHPGARLG